MKTLRLLGPLVVLTLLAAPILLASDHADPMVVTEPEANITDLFFFPHDDNYVLIFNVRRATSKGTPFPITPYEYKINIDLHSQLQFDDESRARYGGKVVNPDGIKPDVVFSLKLNENLTLTQKNVTGLTNPGAIRWWSGLRDDPFNFVRFFKKNAISVVAEIPKASFPPNQENFLLWGTTWKDGKELDHVGRSSRTQQGRFDFLNTLPPGEHVKAIMEQMKKRGDLQTFFNKYKLTVPLANAAEILTLVRWYDLAPDVMVYSTRYPALFPNGRKLEDDVVGITCATGDCVLQELSAIEGPYPRPVMNDKPFLTTFPYEADPWPEMPEKPGPVSFWRIGIWILLIVLLLIALYTWIVYRIGKRAGMHAAHLGA